MGALALRLLARFRCSVTLDRHVHLPCSRRRGNLRASDELRSTSDLRSAAATGNIRRATATGNLRRGAATGNLRRAAAAVCGARDNVRCTDDLCGTHILRSTDDLRCSGANDLCCPNILRSTDDIRGTRGVWWWVLIDGA